MADIIPTDNDDDDIQLGATKGIFRTNNRRRHTYRPPKSEGGAKVDRRGRWTYDIEYELTKKVKDDRQLKGSTSSKILTKEIFCTTGSNWLKPNSSPNGQMYRINEVGDNNTKQGFLNEYGVTPFNPRKEYEDNPFEGRDVIKGHSADLVRRADVVLLHGSSAINYAILYKKPIIQKMEKTMRFLTKIQIVSIYNLGSKNIF